MPELTPANSPPRIVVVFPNGGLSQLHETSLPRWVARGSVYQGAQDVELLQRVVQILGRPAVTEGLAALRLWGHAGERPQGWVAAADPVFLEAMLDHLRLHYLWPDDLDVAQSQALFSEIQTVLGNGAETAFSCVAGCGYLQTQDAFQTASVSAAVADGARPESLLPAGAPEERYDRLLSEIQMCLHASEVNATRQADGRHPANSLWLWGGGFARDYKPVSPYVLFSDDPLFRGYWTSCSGQISPWHGSIGACLAESFERAVIVLPHSPTEVTMPAMLKILNELSDLQKDQRLFPLQLVFRDGAGICLEAMDRFKFWRNNLPVQGNAE